MKIKNLFFGACAVAALTACNSSDELVDVQQQPMFGEDGTGYIAFSVQLPTDNSATRGENDKFDPGLAAEYKVHNVALLLFKGATEDAALYQEYVDMTDVDFGDPQSGNVTLDKKYVAKISGMDIAAGEKVWALAVINRNKVFDHTANTIGGVDMAGKTFADVKKIIVNTNLFANGNGEGADAALQSPAGGILMLNAPLSDTKGTDKNLTNEDIKNANVTILQDVTSSIFPTENEARQGTCSNIYVERAVAKVTVEYTQSEGTTDGFSYEFNQWALDNTNAHSFVIRNMANFRGQDGYVNPLTNTATDIPATFNLKSHSLDKDKSIYRMIGGNSVKHDAPVSAGSADKKDRYRTYFAIDPNYNVGGKFNEYIGNTGSNLKRDFGVGNPAYCAENVFDVDHQIWKETTRVLVSVRLKYKNGCTFYAHPGDATFLTEDVVKELAYNAAIKKYRDAIYKYREAGLLEGSITPTSTGVTMSIAKNTGGIQNADNVTVTLPTNNITVGSTITNTMVAAANIQDANGDPITTVAQVESDLATINNHFAKQGISHSEMGVRYYDNGVSYYQVRIKHFGNEYTPWNDDEANDGAGHPSAGGITSAYPVGEHRACNYLGRYGVLRNNWYSITLSDVIKIGYPTLDDLDLTPVEPGNPGAPEDPIDPNTPDDHIEKEQWINAEVNILSWAKRTQTNVLGED